MREVLRHKCSRRGDYYQRQLTDLSIGTKSATWKSILFSSSPITFAYTKRQVRYILFAVAVL